MALREVTVEINATYIAKIYANSAEEAQRKAGDIMLSNLTPVSREEVILDVQPIKETTQMQDIKQQVNVYGWTEYWENGCNTDLKDTEIQKKRWKSLPDIDNDIIKTWLDSLLESKNKMFVEELTTEEIQAEIEETMGSINNFRSWGDRHAVIDCEDYIKVLEEILEELE